ncbi:MAG: hypothetical protein QOE93_334 [Actinomycetota bacterium]|nr:hypothetical protein [Actinomycetota bacterium]
MAATAVPTLRRRTLLSGGAFRFAVAILAGCAFVTHVTPATAAQRPATPASQGVFVQVSTLGPTFSPAQVQAWMERICAGRQVVLQDVAGQDGRLFTTYLDVIAPYLPGGSKACFTKVFVGTVDLAWTGTGSKYSEGVQDAAFQERYLAMSNTAARAFVGRYPRTKVNWYLTYEANLNLLYYPEVHKAYRSMLATEMRNLRSIRAGSTMWSPTFAYPYSDYSSNVAGMTQLRANLINLFGTWGATAGGLQVLNLQDFVAGSACDPAWNQTTPEDAVGWVNFLGSLGQVPTVQLNVEQYSFDCDAGTIGPGNAGELAARTSFYRSLNVALGPAFEIRYWMPANGFSL